mgnify:CR=1 FL=1
MLQLFTDTSANLPVALTKQHHITVVPFSYTVDGKETDYPDDADFDGAAFYGAMRRGAVVKTSMVNPDLMANYFERALSQGDDVLYVGMSGGISGTAHAAALAAEELREKYPHAKIMTIDTYAASLGEGLQVLEAAELLRAGRSFEEVGDRILARRPHMCQFFTVDDLNHLKRGGRINAATALFGTMLAIKPVMHVDDEGRLIPVSKARGRKASLTALVDRMEATAIDPAGQTVFISHGDCLEDAEFVAGEVRRRLGVETVHINYVGPVIGNHSGPGTMALFFLGSER